MDRAAPALTHENHLELLLEQLSARAHQQAAVAALGQAALAGADVDTLFEDAVRSVARTLPAELAAVAELTAAGQALRLRAGVGWREGVVGSATLEAGVDLEAGYALGSGGPAVTDGFADTPTALLREHGVASGISVTIRAGNRPFGVLAAFSTRPGAFGADDVDWLQAVANVLGLALTNRQTARFLDENPNPVLRLAAGGALLYANAAGAELLREWEGSVPAPLSVPAAEALAARARRSVDVTCRARVYSFDVVPVPDSGYADLWGRDVTDREQMLARLQKANEQLASQADDLATQTEKLGVQAEELEVQNRELQVAGTLIETERQRYQELFALAPDGYLLTSLDGSIHEANHAAAEMLGGSWQFLAGKPLPMFVSQEVRHDFRRHLARLRLPAFSAPLGWETVLRSRRGGGPIPVSVRVGWVRNSQGEPIGLRWLLHDISHLKDVEASLRRAMDTLGILLDISRRLALSPDLPPLLSLILDQLHRLIGFDAAAIDLLADGETLLPAAYWGPPGADLSRLRGEPPAGSLLGQHLLHARAPVLVADVRADTAQTRALRASAGEWLTPLVGRARAFLAVPLLIQDRAVGVLSLQHSRAGYFTGPHVELAQAFAAQAALAVENNRLYQQARALAALDERQRLARDLHDAVSQTLFSASLIAEVLPRIWDRNEAAGRQALQELATLNRSALAEMRTLLRELRPAALLEVELDTLLQQLADIVASRAAVAVQLDLEPPGQLPPEAQVSLYRIAQEALSNVIKHARARQVSVSLRQLSALDGHRRLAIDIHDDGQGFDPARLDANALGMEIIYERAQAIGAALTVDSQPGGGTRVRVVWTEDGPAQN